MYTEEHRLQINLFYRRSLVVCTAKDRKSAPISEADILMIFFRQTRALLLIEGSKLPVERTLGKAATAVRSPRAGKPATCRPAYPAAPTSAQVGAAALSTSPPSLEAQAGK
jgi:hypothetical protein